MSPDAIKTLLKRFPARRLPNGNVMTCPVRLSYPYLFKPGKPYEEGQEPRYSVALLFPKGADLSLLEEVCDEALEAKLGPDWEDARYELPFRDQGEYKKKAGYEKGATWFRSTSTRKPGVVDRNGKPITDEDKVYGGVWALVTLRPFIPGQKMISVRFMLQNVQILMDDEKLGGGAPSAQEEFTPIEGLDDLDAMFAGESADDALAALG